MFYQHNSTITITKENYSLVLKQKKLLIKKLHNLFTSLDIKYVIGHGNLIEYVRGQPIYHDDDIDIRVDVNDAHKWFAYCCKINKDECSERPFNYVDKQNGLSFDNRVHDADRQNKNGLQVVLYNIKNDPFIIHADIVFNYVTSDFWMNYDINYDKIKKINYIGHETYVPCDDDIERVLSKQYGKNYIIPKYNYELI